MQHNLVEQQLRRFLLAICVFILFGTILELVLIEHTGDLVQWVPFGLSGLGILSLLWFWVKPSVRAIYTVRAVMGALALGSLFGVYEHFFANYEFSKEIHPAYTLFENVVAALKGVSPMLAPGVLFLVALLAIAMTYKHPLLDNNIGSADNA